MDGPAAMNGQFAHDLDAVEKQRQTNESPDHESPLAKLFDDQLACADFVVVNKSDLLGQKASGRGEQDLDGREAEEDEQRWVARHLSISHGRLVDHSVCTHGSLGLHLQREDRPRDLQLQDSEQLPLRPQTSSPCYRRQAFRSPISTSLNNGLMTGFCIKDSEALYQEI